MSTLGAAHRSVSDAVVWKMLKISCILCLYRLEREKEKEREGERERSIEREREKERKTEREKERERESHIASVAKNPGPLLPKQRPAYRCAHCWS